MYTWPIGTHFYIFHCEKIKIIKNTTFLKKLIRFFYCRGLLEVFNLFQTATATFTIIFSFTFHPVNVLYWPNVNDFRLWKLRDKSRKPAVSAKHYGRMSGGCIFRPGVDPRTNVSVPDNRARHKRRYDDDARTAHGHRSPEWCRNRISAHTRYHYCARGRPWSGLATHLLFIVVLIRIFSRKTYKVCSKSNETISINHFVCIFYLQINSVDFKIVPFGFHATPETFLPLSASYVERW